MPKKEIPFAPIVKTFRLLKKGPDVAKKDFFVKHVQNGSPLTIQKKIPFYGSLILMVFLSVNLVTQMHYLQHKPMYE
jgi:hypothetical protein